MTAAAVTEWLLDSDPALRWQVERDLVGEPQEVWRRRGPGSPRRASARGCWRCRTRTASGRAARSFPRTSTSRARGGRGCGQPWTATTWSLNASAGVGAGPGRAAGRRTAELLAANSRWEYDDLPYWGGEVDCCINAWTLANGVWLGADVAGIVDWFVEHRLADGGWNCEWVEGSTRSSFHSTLNSLKGLLAYDAATGGTAATREARRAGEEYLLTARPVPAAVDGRAGGPVGDPVRLPVPLVLQRAQRGRLLPTGGAARRHGAGPPHGRRHRADPRRPPARRHLAPGRAGTPGGCGSRSTCRQESRRSG